MNKFVSRLILNKIVFMFSIFLYGFLGSFLGFTLPSVLNMTALKIRLNATKKEFTNFTLGVLLVVFIQVYISVYILEYFSTNTVLIAFLEKTCVLVLVLLSIYFYVQHKKEQKKIEIKTKNSFFTGVILSLLNMFAIPFFCSLVAILIAFNSFSFNTVSNFFFVVGAVFGTYSILLIYGKFAFVIKQKTGKFTNHINLFLCVLTAVFALCTLLKFVL